MTEDVEKLIKDSERALGRDRERPWFQLLEKRFIYTGALIFYLVLMVVLGYILVKGIIPIYVGLIYDVWSFILPDLLPMNEQSTLASMMMLLSPIIFVELASPGTVGWIRDGLVALIFDVPSDLVVAIYTGVFPGRENDREQEVYY